MKHSAKVLALGMICACMWALSGQAASAAPLTTASAPPAKVPVVVDGVTYFIQPGQEVVIPLKNKAPADADPKTVPTEVHVQLAAPSSGASSAASGGALSAATANCWSSNGAWGAFYNAFGTTLGSYELDVSYSTDTGATPYPLVTSHTITYDHWYANGGLAWYYNADMRIDTADNRESVRTARSVHFTGPFWQTENIQVAVDMHGDCSSTARWWVFGGDNKWQ